jgi:hypothetical protein
MPIWGEGALAPDRDASFFNVSLRRAGGVRGRGGDGDARGGGVVAQVLAGGQGAGPGRDGGGGGGQELAGAGQFVADGGAVAAGQGGDRAGGQVEPLVEDGGQDVAGEGDLLPGVVAGGGGPLAVPAAACGAQPGAPRLQLRLSFVADRLSAL